MPTPRSSLPTWTTNAPNSKLAEVELAELEKNWPKSKLAELDRAHTSSELGLLFELSLNSDLVLSALDTSIWSRPTLAKPTLANLARVSFKMFLADFGQTDLARICVLVFGPLFFSRGPMCAPDSPDPKPQPRTPQPWTPPTPDPPAPDPLRRTSKIWRFFFLSRPSFVCFFEFPRICVELRWSLRVFILKNVLKNTFGLSGHLVKPRRPRSLGFHKMTHLDRLHPDRPPRTALTPTAPTRTAPTRTPHPDRPPGPHQDRTHPDRPPETLKH